MIEKVNLKTAVEAVVKDMTIFLMMELDGTLNKENSGNLYED